MALTFTRAGAQAHLDTFNDALAARSWAAARDALNSYTIVRAELAQSQSLDGAAQSFPAADVLEGLLEKTRLEAGRASDNQRRVARGRTSYGRR